MLADYSDAVKPPVVYLILPRRVGPSRLSRLRDGRLLPVDDDGALRLQVATRSSASHDASHDKDHDDDDLSCAGPCPAGLTACDGRCVDLRSDPDNCGRCDNECEDKYAQVCSNGKCAAKCAPTLSNCSGACVDETVDPANCGACGFACGCGQVCTGGVCVTPGVCKQEGELCTGTECCVGLLCLAGVCSIAG